MNDVSQSSAGARCSSCGAELDPSRAQGLCPACTWKWLAQQANEEEAKPAPGASREGLFELQNHRVLEEIARGGMGIVYRAQQLNPARIVAVKMLLPHQLGSAEMRERFRLEIRAIVGLEHPAILPVYQVGEYEGMPYFTMKLATGGTLASRAPELAGQFRRITELLITLAEAIHFAHERGVLHRDLKPGNILFDESGRPYVSDFGLAKFTEADGDKTPSLTRSVHLLGTPHFLPPEMVAGGVTRATMAADVYGLGAILYELLAGQAPFVADNLSSLFKAIAESEPISPSKLAPGIPRDLEVICLKCLAKDPARRYRSAGELRDDLQRWLEDRPILARPMSPLERAWQWARHHRSLAVLSLLLGSSLVLGTGLLLRANYRLEAALRANVSANAAAQRNLYGALLEQARLLRSTGDSSQRSNLLAVLREAARIQPSLEVRNEAVAALAMPASGNPAAPGPNAVFTQFAESKDQSQSCTVDVSRDGRVLVTGTLEAVHLWDTRSRVEIWSRPQIAVPWMYVAFPPEGKSLLYSARNFGIRQSAFEITEPASPPARVQVSAPETIGRGLDSTIMGFTATGRDWIVAADRSGFYISRVEVWPDGNPEQPGLVAEGRRITWLALSPDRRWAASTTVPAYDVRIWAIGATNSFLLAGATNAMMSAFSTDGRHLLARMPKEYGLWDTTSWRLVRQWHVGFGGRSTSPILFSRAGALVAAPLGGNRFQLLDTQSFSELCLLTPPVAFETAWAVWSRDDQKLYVMDGSHRVFEWDLGELRRQLASLGLDWSSSAPRPLKVVPLPAPPR